MKNLKVSAKLFVSFIIVIVLSLIIGAFGIVGMGRIDASMDDMYEHQTLPMEDLAHAIEYVQRLRVQLRNAVLYTGDLEELATVKADIQTREQMYREYMEDYSRKITNPEVVTLFDNTMKVFDNEFMPGLYAIVAEAEKGLAQPQLMDMMTDLTPAADAVRDNTLELMSIKMVDAETANLAATSLYNTLLILIIAVLFIAVVVSVFLAIYVSGLISKPLAVLSTFMDRAGSTGDVAFRAEEAESIHKYSKVKDEIGNTIKGSAAFIEHVTTIAQELETISSGDLTPDIKLLSDEDVMGVSLKNMVDNLNNMFSEINSSTEQVSAGSKQIAEGAQALAQGSTEQAASIEELSSSISEIARKTKENSDMAVQTANLAHTIKSNAEKGEQQMSEMMSAVKDINAASQSISKVIKVIDDIAFQTNILALNAAVEAARAGQHGKGFAVVAEEVRNLAAKSAEAAKNTGELIQNSMEKAEFGARIADDTSSSLVEIVAGISESNRLIVDIATSSEEQSISITQINTGIDQVAQVVQQNSATAQESAAASEEMSGQSDVLQQLIAQFKLKGGNAGFGGVPYMDRPTQSSAPLPQNTWRPPDSAGGFGKY